MQTFRCDHPLCTTCDPTWCACQCPRCIVPAGTPRSTDCSDADELNASLAIGIAMNGIQQKYENQIKKGQRMSAYTPTNRRAAHTYNAHLFATGAEGTATRLSDGVIQFRADDGSVTTHTLSEVVLCGRTDLADVPTPVQAPPAPQSPAPAPMLPEAPSSANVFVELPGIGRVQLTARGTDGTQVVTDLLTMVDAAHTQAAKRQQAQADAAAAQKQAELESAHAAAYAQLKASWLDQASNKGGACLARVEKAFTIFEAGAVQKSALLQDAWQVRSQASEEIYIVDAQGCTCPAAVHKPEQTCKHRLAVCLAKKVAAMKW